MSTRETVKEVTPGASRRDLLKNGVTASLASGLAMMAAQDLAAHQIEQFKDLQFSTPSVTYTKGNFT